MKKERRIEEWLTRKLPQIVLILCVLQPLLDVLSYWVIELDYSNTITLLLRLLLLGGIILLGFFLSDRRWIYWSMAGILLLFTAGHMLACAQEGYLAPLDDLTNLVRIYQLPLTTVAFITYFRRNAACIEALKKGFFLSLLVIVAVELLSAVTGTNPYTYPTKSIGLLGWFYFANSQSAILCLLTPVAIVYVIAKEKYHPLAAFGVGLLALGNLYLFATRLSYAALLGIGVALSISLCILKLTRKLPTLRAAGALLLCTAAALCLFTVSPMYRNRQLLADNLAIKQADIDTLVAQDDAAAEAEGLTGTERELASLRSAYEKYIPGPTGRFGLERTAELYGYATDADTVTNFRLEKINYCKLLLEDSRSLTHLFGAELEQLAFGGGNYDPENDFHGIYVLCGAVGLGLMVLFLLYFVCRIVRALLRSFTEVFTWEAAGFGVALITCVVHAYYTAGVLRRPNVTFYLGTILAAIYILTRKAQKREETL